MNPLLSKLAGGASKIKWKIVFLVCLALVVFFVFAAPGSSPFAAVMKAVIARVQEST